MFQKVNTVYRGISISPQRSDLPFRYENPLLKLDELTPRRNSELAHVMDQAELESVLRRQVDLLGPFCF